MDSLINLETVNKMSAELQSYIAPNIEPIDLSSLWNGSDDDQKINIFINYAYALGEVRRKFLAGLLNEDEV